MELVDVVYVGPMGSVEIHTGHDVREDLNDGEWVTVAHGETVAVPAWKAHGAPSLPGLALVDDEEVEFGYGEEPAGEVLYAPVPPLGGLLDQVDNWVLPGEFKKAKSTGKAKPDPEVAATDPEGEAR